MNLFKNDKRLAVLLAGNPELYNQLKSSLDALQGRKVLEPSVEEDLAFTRQTLESANSIARESDYFVFSVYDSWGDEQSGRGDGYAVFQKVKRTMVERLGIVNVAPQFENVIDFLRENQVKRAFTLHIPLDGYYGLRYENLSGEDNQDVIRYEGLDERFVEAFKKQGIELILLL